MHMVDEHVLFSAKNISKRYPGTLALNNVCFDILPGEVVGLVGENGAGKSTLLKIVMGIEQPTEGFMEMRGARYAPQTPIEANEHGVGMVFQEQSLIQNLTVGQNIFFGQEDRYTRFGIVSRRRMYEDARQVLANVEMHSIRPDKKVSTLDFATRQMVEIAKVFNIVKSSGASKSVVLLDEPTSVLNEGEVKNLFANIRKITATGNSVVFISHRLDEVLEISDRIYVFKDGHNVTVIKKDEASEAILYEKMVGKSASGEYYKIDRQSTPGAEVVFEARSLGLRGYFSNVSFKLHKGEVLGICGVIGSGKEDLCAVICGDESPTSGEMLVKGKAHAFNSPYQALEAGILSIPKERREESIIAEATVYENLAMSNYKAFKRKGFISTRLTQESARKHVQSLSIKCPSIKQKVGYLSGGNAQKVVFGRILSSNADILLLNHPTRGVDIGAKEEIYSLVREITASGKGVIVLGDTLDECIGLSNRIIVMKDGIITKEYDASPSNKPEPVDIVKYMM